MEDIINEIKMKAATMEVYAEILEHQLMSNSETDNLKRKGKAQCLMHG